MSLSRWKNCTLLQGCFLRQNTLVCLQQVNEWNSLSYFIQGADTVIYERLANGNHDLKRTSRDHLEHFGASGLRTLCLAYRDLSSDVYESWNEKYIQAKSALRDREKKLDEVCA